MQDVSGAGLSVKIIAVPLFPTGFDVTRFASDTDPFDIPNLTIAETSMGLNGDLEVWTTPVPTVINLSVIPNTEEDENLGIIWDAEKYERNKVHIPNNITMIATYPDGKIVVLPVGRLTGGPAMNSVSQGKRIKSKTYTFTFEGKAN